MAAVGLFPGLVLIFFALFIVTALLLSVDRSAGHQPSAPRLGSGLRNVLPAGLMHRYEHLLTLAGSPRDMSIETLLGLKVFAAPVGLVGVLILASLTGLSLLTSVPVLLLLTVGMTFLPDLWLSNIATKRQAQIRRDLPDTLDLLTINVEAGLGFDTAVGRIIDNMIGPLIHEFSRMLREMQLGRSRGEALRALMDRTKVPELNSFVLAIIEADLFGISIGQTLRSQSRDMRVRRRQNAEQTAMKMPVKIIFPLILFIFPAIVIVIVGPAGIRIFTVLGSQ